jgi:hypothetical protein
MRAYYYWDGVRNIMESPLDDLDRSIIFGISDEAVGAMVNHLNYLIHLKKKKKAKAQSLVDKSA